MLANAKIFASNPNHWMANHLENDIKSLVKSLQNGDSEAYKVLFDKHYLELHRLASLYVVDKTAADDIVQDAFIYLFNHSSELYKIANIVAYMRKAVRNRCLNYLRDLNLEDRGKRMYCEELAALDDAYDDDVQELLDRVMHEADSLPETCHEIWSLRFEKGLKIKDIADKLGLAEGTVKVQIHRAVLKLRDKLS